MHFTILGINNKKDYHHLHHKETNKHKELTPEEEEKR